MPRIRHRSGKGEREHAKGEGPREGREHGRRQTRALGKKAIERRELK